MRRQLCSCIASEIPGDSTEVSPALKNVFLITLCPLADNAVSDKSRGREAFRAATMHLPSTGLHTAHLVQPLHGSWAPVKPGVAFLGKCRLPHNSMAAPPVKGSALLSVIGPLMTYND